MIPTNNSGMFNYMKKNIAVWTTVFILNVVDIFLTVKDLNGDSGNRELNPIMSVLIKVDPIVSVIVKMVIVTIIIYLTYKYVSIYPRIHKVSCYYFVAFFFLIDVNNLVLLLG